MEFGNFKVKEPITFTDLINKESISEDVVSQLKQAIQEERNIVIFGGTGCGKSTLLEALLRETALNLYDRNVYVSDYSEIQNTGESFFTFDKSVSDKGIAANIIGALKMVPDYLFVDEIRDGKSVKSCELAHLSGVPIVVTFHSNSKEQAILRLETLFKREYNLKEERLSFLENAFFVGVKRDSIGVRSIFIP